MSVYTIGDGVTAELREDINGVTLKAGTDYVVRYGENKAGRGTVAIICRGDYTGTLIRSFAIVDCAVKIVPGKTYQIVPKSNPDAAVCSRSGKMINNTKLQLSGRSGSEAMRFKAVKNADGTWKLINAKCELAFAVQQNSSVLGKGLVLYDQTTRKAQNWIIRRKWDNSFTITNSVSGYSAALSSSSAKAGTTLKTAETVTTSLQRFYFVEVDGVDSSYNGTCTIRASKNRNYAVDVIGCSKVAGADVKLYAYNGSPAQVFKVIYSGAGYYRIVNVNSGLVLTVKGNTKKNGADVVQDKWVALSGQRWKINKNGNGTVTLTNVLGTVLHLANNSIQNHSNIVARVPAETGAQKWDFENAA